ncbi:hypothetical protein C0Q70_06563 [Pomacea canaliculata]|uniref:Uncharacterized protein n=1 Tax=Pomacea canaliculata TaxID=400727 RepID=A0A2T7PPD6_POMCA|nr:hypothetical protein C0Q70_06563 [Pomacea canaliculata]
MRLTATIKREGKVWGHSNCITTVGSLGQGVGSQCITTVGSLGQGVGSQCITTVGNLGHGVGSQCITTVGNLGQGVGSQCIRTVGKLEGRSPSRRSSAAVSTASLALQWLTTLLGFRLLILRMTSEFSYEPSVVSRSRLSDTAILKYSRKLSGGLIVRVVSVVCMSLYVFRYLAQGKIDAVPGQKVPPSTLGVHPGRHRLVRNRCHRAPDHCPPLSGQGSEGLGNRVAVLLLLSPHRQLVDTLFTYPALGVAVYCFQCYCFACVVSQYQELSEGRGTYEFLYKPRRRQHLSQPLADGDLYSPPYWAQLPPYSKVDLHKEFNPPGYEEAADQSHAAYDNPAFVTASSASLSASLQSCRGQQQGQGQAITPGDVACPAPSHRPRAER